MVFNCIPLTSPECNVQKSQFEKKNLFLRNEKPNAVLDKNNEVTLNFSHNEIIYSF